MVPASKNKVENAIVNILAFLLEGVIVLAILLMLVQCVIKNAALEPFHERFTADGKPCPVTYWLSPC